MFLKILPTSLENNCVGDFFNKVAGLQPARFLKRDSNTTAFLRSFGTFKNTYFEENLRMAASKNVFMKLRKFKIYSSEILVLH